MYFYQLFPTIKWGRNIVCRFQMKQRNEDSANKNTQRADLSINIKSALYIIFNEVLFSLFSISIWILFH